MMSRTKLDPCLSPKEANIINLLNQRTSFPFWPVDSFGQRMSCRATGALHDLWTHEDPSQASCESDTIWERMSPSHSCTLQSSHIWQRRIHKHPAIIDDFPSQKGVPVTKLTQEGMKYRVGGPGRTTLDSVYVATRYPRTIVIQRDFNLHTRHSRVTSQTYQ